MRFHDAFEEVESLHQAAKLDEGEQELRERLKGEVERMIVPTYTKFLARHRNGDFSKSAPSLPLGPLEAGNLLWPSPLTRQTRPST